MPRATPKAVEAEAAKLPAEMDDGRHQGTRHTLGELVDEYLRHQDARGRAPKTMLEARRRAESIKADPIGSKDVRRLSGRDLDEVYARLASAGGPSGKGMHTTTRHHFHALVRAALNQAIRWRWLSPPNPATEALAPALAPDERVPPTPDEARHLALAVSNENPDLAELIFVDATTGMRRGEICALRFCDIDIDGGEATIWWRCSDLPRDHSGGSGRGRRESRGCGGGLWCETWCGLDVARGKQDAKGASLAGAGAARWCGADGDDATTVYPHESEVVR